MSDLFGFFNRMNAGDFESVDKLEEDDLKAISPYVMLMWCHGAQSNTAEHVILTDTYCNEYVFSLQKHPKLLLKCFVHANSGMGNTRYKFTKSVSKEETVLNRIIARHYECSLSQAKEIRGMITDNDVTMLKEIYGEL